MDQEDKIVERTVERVTNYLIEGKGYSREQVESSIVQDAIRASASSIIGGTWEGPLAGNSSILIREGSYTAGIIPGITEETEEQKEENGEKDKSEKEY